MGECAKEDIKRFSNFVITKFQNELTSSAAASTFSRIIRYNCQVLTNERDELIKYVVILLLTEPESINRYKTSLKDMMEALAAFALLESSPERTT